MPYIPQARREALKLVFVDGQTVGVPGPDNAGELNYVVTKLVSEYVASPACERLSYAKINETIGVLECAKLELYRRIAAPYEEHKIMENGDVYPVSIGGEVSGHEFRPTVEEIFRVPPAPTSFTPIFEGEVDYSSHMSLGDISTPLMPTIDDSFLRGQRIEFDGTGPVTITPITETTCTIDVTKANDHLVNAVSNLEK